MQYFTRGNMRHDYDIDGNACSDCLTSWCCPCCVLVQEHKEVEERRVPDNRQGYACNIFTNDICAALVASKTPFDS